MENIDDDHAHFPLEEQVEDFSGKLRTFVIDCHEGPLGFTLRAHEKGSEGVGYEFGAYSETSPYNALYRVRQKCTGAWQPGTSLRHQVPLAATGCCTIDWVAGSLRMAKVVWSWSLMAYP